MQWTYWMGVSSLAGFQKFDSHPGVALSVCARFRSMKRSILNKTAHRNSLRLKRLDDSEHGVWTQFIRTASNDSICGHHSTSAVMKIDQPICSFNKDALQRHLPFLVRSFGFRQKTRRSQRAEQAPAHAPRVHTPIHEATRLLVIHQEPQ